ncbi:MAG: 4-hydroxythreonine-4-phosphate dehydrogenase PdxA [Vicingaceae bacterium]
MITHLKSNLGITIGDVNGIGPEVLLKTFADQRLFELCIPVVYGSREVLRQYAKILGIIDFNILGISNLTEVRENTLNVIEVQEKQIDISPGKPSLEGAALAFSSMEKAASDALEGHIDGIITSPLNKKNIESIHPDFTGHTSYFSLRAGNEAQMILASDKIKIAMVTGHVPIAKVSAMLSIEGIFNCIQTLSQSLTNDFAITNPSIAVLGLNPHAGEEGLLGKEEQEVIIPAIEMARSEKINCTGPLASDGFFGAGSYKKFDGILAMYHDQALIPFKTISFDDGVNFSANLSFVRTSPDHGTAYDIAGKGLASESSFKQSVYLAHTIWSRRTSHLDK